MDNEELHEIVKNNKFGFSGIGLYRWGCHVDTREGPYAFWREHDKKSKRKSTTT